MIAKLKDYFRKDRLDEEFSMMETQTKLHVDKLRDALKRAEEKARQVAHELEKKIDGHRE